MRISDWSSDVCSSDLAEGKDYFFVGQERFTAMIAGGELLEHAVVFGNNYGTPRAPVEAALERGRDVLFDIDWQGTQQLRETARDDLVRDRKSTRLNSSH